MMHCVSSHDATNTKYVALPTALMMNSNKKQKFTSRFNMNPSQMNDLILAVVGLVSANTFALFVAVAFFTLLVMNDYGIWASSALTAGLFFTVLCLTSGLLIMRFDA